MPSPKFKAPYLPGPERHDELSEGTAAPQSSAMVQNRPTGPIRKGERNRPSAGGKATRDTTQLSHRIDSASLPEVYRKRAQTLRRMTCAELARTVGGGTCGIIPSLFVKHAAIATALAEHALRRRVDEVPSDREVWVYCAAGQRAYFAQRLLRQRGVDAKNLSGGYTTWLALRDAGDA